VRTLALTGGIASGKSTVAKYFEELGTVVLYADREAHQCYAPGTDLFQELQRRYGPSIVSAGQIDRRRLGEIVFSSPAERQWLESRIHPWTRARMAEKLADYSRKNPPLVLVEAALHVETGYYREFEGLILVYLPESLALERLKKRDDLSMEQARLRLASQMPIEEKKKLADWVIDNSGSLEETKKQVERLYKELISFVPRAAESPPPR
jgi:dephospho-CoA kinase